MAQKWNWLKVTTIAGLIALSLATVTDAAEKNKLTIGYSSTGPTAVGLWTAQAVGAFNKYSVDANFVFISSSPVMVPALIGGDVQCAIAGANAVIAAALGGAPIVSIASLANGPYLRLWVQPEFTRVEAEPVAATLEMMGKKGLPVEAFADNTIIDKLVREGFIEQLYKKR